MIFKNIKNTQLTNFQDSCYITFDIDWASDKILEYTLDIIEKYNVKATFFVTHETILLKRMRENPNIELGIHPNFNFLLNGDFRYGKNMKEVAEYFLKIVPEAVSVRSHSLTNQSNMFDIFSQLGLKFECNFLIPMRSNIIVKPFLHWDKKLTRVPHYWEDDVHCLYGDDWKLDNYYKYEGIKIFNFHPIHIALNTECMDRYITIRNVQQNSSIVFKNRFDGYGSESFLIDLIKKVKSEM